MLQSKKKKKNKSLTTILNKLLQCANYSLFLIGSIQIGSINDLQFDTVLTRRFDQSLKQTRQKGVKKIY